MEQKVIRKLTKHCLRYDEFKKIVREYNLKPIEIANLINELNPDSYTNQRLAEYLITYDSNIVNYLLQNMPEFSENYIFKRYVSIEKLWGCINESNFYNLTELELAIIIVLLYSKNKFTEINYIMETNKNKLEDIMYHLGEIYVDFRFDIIKNVFYYSIENMDKSKKFDCIFSFIHGVDVRISESWAVI